MGNQGTERLSGLEQRADQPCAVMLTTSAGHQLHCVWELQTQCGFLLSGSGGPLASSSWARRPCAHSHARTALCEGLKIYSAGGLKVQVGHPRTSAHVVLLVFALLRSLICAHSLAAFRESLSLADRNMLGVSFPCDLSAKTAGGSFRDRCAGSSLCTLLSWCK